ncbi:hypothetical protein H0I23_05065 [Cellulophaga sp. HaHaR_3_176]|uniref:hypothetical protein n=1 Tax=Cellulophaga sp. HaHaR_3_176 TaxID=1942464 RepID=UPI001C1F7766|nr:hypothetical protein [Cellulophaga sp. HaHaR_3_176]QWX85009.1 hypothetical protein H0I23_05065 [Cellulophaga sp. HaHaR_3_176]
MNQDVNNTLNEITEIHLSLKEVYQKLSEDSSGEQQQNYNSKEEHFESLSKEMIKLIYNLGGKYIECKNPTEQELQDLIAMISNKNDTIAFEKVEEKVAEFKKIAREKYETVLQEHEFSQDEEELLKTHINKL